MGAVMSYVYTQGEDDVNTQDDRGMTKLRTAAVFGTVEEVRHLVEPSPLLTVYDSGLPHPGWGCPQHPEQ